MVSKKRNDILGFVLTVVILILINYLASFISMRWDLTSEKRYSLNEVTENLTKEIDDVILFKVYLDGDLNAGFQRLQRETIQMLDELRAHNPLIEYEFINPSDNEDVEITREIYEQLRFKGLEPIQVEEYNPDGKTMKQIFPGAIASYKDREIPAQLLLNQFASAPEAQINISIQNLEYTLANTIRKLLIQDRPTVAFLKGHGELGDKYIADIARELSQYYKLEKFNSKEFKADTATGEISLQNQLMRLNTFDALIIAKPTKNFNDLDKLLLDQYVMRGGKTLWLIDAVSADLDSLSKKQSFLAFPISDQIGLTDLLFKYGVRINSNLVQDMVSAGVHDTREVNRWIYFPLLMPQAKHPIAKDLNAVKLEFASSIDTIIAPGIKKTILLRSSPYSKTVTTPHLVNIGTLYEEQREENFRQQFLPMAVLLEGKFKSAFTNRILPKNEDGSTIPILKESPETQMIVVGDGDIIKNQLNIINPNIPRGMPLPLGYDQFTGMQFGNKDFIMNAVDYMLDESGLINIRSRELKLRLLDTKKIKSDRLTWQLVNVALPIILIILFGILYNFIRKRKYVN